MSKKLLFGVCLLALSATQCTYSNQKDLVVEGYRPVYEQKTTNVISAGDTVALGSLGKIYYKAPYLYVGKPGKGVHILDVRNGTLKNVAFIHITGCNDIAIRDNVLYADSFNDLVALQLGNTPQAISFLKRITNVFSNPSFATRPILTEQSYFECVDATKGVVVGWEKATLTNPKCHN
jgi:hypothetical protein